MSALDHAMDVMSNETPQSEGLTETVETPAAVAYFAFARPQQTAASLAALMANVGAEDAPLYVFADGARTVADASQVAEVRAILAGATGFKSVHWTCREGNLGCARSVIEGVSEVLRQHLSVIVIEDDIVTAPYFLQYMNRSLACYRSRPDILSVSAFAPPPERFGLPLRYEHDVYLSRRNSSWGWGTWRDRWLQVDWQVRDYPVFRRASKRRRAFNQGGNDLSPMLDAQMKGRIDSWSIRFSYAHFVRQAYSLCPRYSYVDHTGDDGSGTHVRKGSGYRIDLSRALTRPRLPTGLQPDPAVLEALRRYHSEHWLAAMLGAIPGVRTLVRGVKDRLGIKGRLL